MKSQETKESKKNNTGANLAYITTFALVIAFIFLFFMEIPKENKDLIVQIMNTLCNVWIAAMAYYHGSSLGSKMKDEYIQKQKNKENVADDLK